MTRLCAFLLLSASMARAQAPSADALDLAHVCQIEAGFSAPDCAAVYWIGVKRGKARDQSPLDALRAYSVPYRTNTARAARIKAWPWSDIPGATARINRKWRAQRSLAVRLLRDEIPDPCPEATEWNDRNSQPRGRMVRVCIGLTANNLYSVEARK